MTKPRGKPKATATLPSPVPEVCFTVEQTPDEVRAILWGIASDSEQSGTARVAACRLLLMDARERDDGDEDPPRCRPQQAGAGPDAQGGELTDEMPIATTYKGVGIHAGQPAKRVALVKREIDKVNKISDLARLFEIAGDCGLEPGSTPFCRSAVPCRPSAFDRAAPGASRH